MSRSVLRCLPLLAVLALAGCQTQKPDPAAGLSGMPAVQAYLTAGNLQEATSRFRQLPPVEGNAEHDAMRRQLVEAWLKRGRRAIEHGDMDRATTALSNIRTLRPQSPALTLDALIRQPKNQ